MALRPIQYPTVNGVRQSPASVTLELIPINANGSPGTPYRTRGWSKLDFERTRDRGDVYGPHPDPLGKTRGQNKYTGSLAMYLAEWNYFVREVLGGPGYGDRFFTVICTYTSNGFDPVKAEIRGCTVDKNAFSNAVGTDATQVEMDLHPIKIVMNDEDDVDDPLAA